MKITETFTQTQTKRFLKSGPATYTYRSTICIRIIIKLNIETKLVT